MLQTEDKWKIMENRRLPDQMENVIKDIWLEVKAKQDWSNYLIINNSLQIQLFKENKKMYSSTSRSAIFHAI